MQMDDEIFWQQLANIAWLMFESSSLDVHQHWDERRLVLHALINEIQWLDLCDYSSRHGADKLIEGELQKQVSSEAEHISFKDLTGFFSMDHKLGHCRAYYSEPVEEIGPQHFRRKYIRHRSATQSSFGGEYEPIANMFKDYKRDSSPIGSSDT